MGTRQLWKCCCDCGGEIDCILMSCHGQKCTLACDWLKWACIGHACALKAQVTGARGSCVLTAVEVLASWCSSDLLCDQALAVVTVDHSGGLPMRRRLIRVEMDPVGARSPQRRVPIQGRPCVKRDPPRGSQLSCRSRSRGWSRRPSFKVQSSNPFRTEVI